jgi:hypothetical protein
MTRRRLFVGFPTPIVAARLVIPLLACVGASCGSADGSTGSTSDTGGPCAEGQVYCHDCNGGGFCSTGGCPGYACPLPEPEGGMDAAGLDSGADVVSDTAAEAAEGDGGPFACGAQTCAPDQWCMYPCCGTPPPCMPVADDSGVCPAGSVTCSAGGQPGCQDTCSTPSCSASPPPPYCTVTGRNVQCTCA